jgi:hypothetical protein
VPALPFHVNSATSLSAPRATVPLEPLAYLQLPGLQLQGHNGLLCPHVLTSPNASCIHGVLLLWREQPGGGTGGGGLLAQGLAQTGCGQRSACKSHPQALPPGLPGLAQNGNAVGPQVPSQSPLQPTQNLSLCAQPLGGIEVGVISSCLLSQLLLWNHIRSPVKPWMQERPVPESTAGALRVFKRPRGWGQG